MARATLVHIGDTLLGKRQYEPGVRCDDSEEAFERAIAVAVEYAVDAVVHTGDLFGDPQPALRTKKRPKRTDADEMRNSPKP